MHHEVTTAHLTGMTVSMRVMSAGDGYRYLLASVTAGDVACHVPWLIVNYVEKGCLIAQQILPARSSHADGWRKVRQLVKAARRRAAGRGAARPGLDPRFGYFRLSDGRPSHVAAAVGTVGCLPNVARYVRLTYMSEARSDQAGSELATLRQRLVEAEEEYVDLATRDDPAAIGWERLPDQESNIRPACARCEFWTAREYEAGRFGITGVCRRYPPSLPSMEGGKFPITHDRNWCGEFRPMTRRLNND